MTLSFKYKKVDRPVPLPPALYPIIPITLRGKEKQLDVMALLDSGADYTAIPKGIAEYIGMDLSKKAETIVGVGGKIQAIPSRVMINIQHGHESYSISAEVRVLDVDDKFPMLIGRKDFFEKFEITFKEKDKRIILKKVS